MAPGQLPHPGGWDGGPTLPQACWHWALLPSAPAHLSGPTAVPCCSLPQLLVLAATPCRGCADPPRPPAGEGDLPACPHGCAVALPQTPATGPAKGSGVLVTCCPSLLLQALAQLSCLPSALPAQFPHSRTRAQGAACPRHSTTRGVGTAPSNQPSAGLCPPPAAPLLCWGLRRALLE